MGISAAKHRHPLHIHTQATIHDSTSHARPRAHAAIYEPRIYLTPTIIAYRITSHRIASRYHTTHHTPHTRARYPQCPSAHQPSGTPKQTTRPPSTATPQPHPPLLHPATPLPPTPPHRRASRPSPAHATRRGPRRCISAGRAMSGAWRMCLRRWPGERRRLRRAWRAG